MVIPAPFSFLLLITSNALSAVKFLDFIFYPTFRSKFSKIHVFTAIDFQSNVDLLYFYVVGKSQLCGIFNVVYLEVKNDIIQFSPNTTKNLNYLHLFKTATRKNIDFRKKYCRT